MKISSQICIPLQPKTMKQCRQQILKAQKQADIIEIWLDHIQDLDLHQLLKWQTKPFLLVNKGKKELGKWTDSEAGRVAILEEASKLGAKFIDIGIHTNPKLIKSLAANKSQSSKLILSFHDFQKTPSDSRLPEIVKELQSFQPDIIKIATHCRDHSDALRLLTLLNQLHTKQTPAIILGMGKFGTFTRLYGCYLGNYLTFTPLDPQKATAPGQISFSNLQKITKSL